MSVANMITVSEDYFSKGCGRCDRFATAECSTRQWESGLRELRRICRAAGLAEVVKWGLPTYHYNGRNIAGLAAFRNDFRLRFFKAALLKDPEGVLQKQGPNTQHAGMISFTDNAQVKKMESIIAAYLQEAIGYAKAGIKPPKVKHQIELPAEMIDAMDSDPDLAEAFHQLTPGR